MKYILYRKIIFNTIYLLLCGILFSCAAIDSFPLDSDTQTVDLCADIDIASETTITIENKSYSIITDKEGLEDIGDDQNTLEDHYILCSDIRLDNTFTQINPDSGTNPDTFEGDEFTGTLEGNHKTILELEIQSESKSFVGLFGAIGTEGEVRNLELSLVDGNDATPSISGYKNVGALVGENLGRITNVWVTGGYVKGDSTIGGLVGRNSFGGIIASNHAAGSVKGNSSIGGLVGTNHSEITNSYATGSVEANSFSGGLVGFNSGDITYSYAIGNVEGSSSTGGLIGYQSSSSEIIDNHFDATTTGQSDTSIQGVTAYYTNPADGKVYTEAGDAGDLINKDDHFPDWDDTIWTWQGDGQWPILQFQ